MLAGFVFDAALGVTAVVSGKAIAAAAMGKRMKQVFALGQFAQTKIEDAGAVAIDQHYAQPRGRAEQVR